MIYVDDPDFTLHLGDVLQELAGMADETVDCVVTSPPYYGLRDYGADGQIGLEETLGDYIDTMVGVFREVRRVLSKHGVMWLNVGDSYNAYNGNPGSSKSINQRLEHAMPTPRRGLSTIGLKPKDLMMVPHRLAIALQDDGWWVRSDVVWDKPNAMPESATDRPTKSHEYVFLLAKSARYFYDEAAVREPVQQVSIERELRHRSSYEAPGQTAQRRGKPHRIEFPKLRKKVTWEERKAAGATRGNVAAEGNVGAGTQRGVHGEGVSHTLGDPESGRNLRSVWRIATKGYRGAHFAVFPEQLVERCILAGCPPHGVVFDPFMGSGTTALIARRLGRRSVGIELNPEYAAMCAERLATLQLLLPEAV